MSKQVRKDSDCEECKEREKTVEDVIQKLKESEVTSLGQKRKSIIDLFKDIRSGTMFAEDQNQITVLTIKIEVSWPEDSQGI
ncbi:hypothetical protein CLV62_1271 [Dysgonomonas alginatilytica]|uniref:Uncharacterized protein n=1 Tax=Dysgonomonas alginatilytica TaxID=1605892 RepID=A0A2V3PM49_9BACT|nr:hypothetical protein [Dysgonomonas alginatilytica]PXV61002.1 hypothetical protein CLV62_1271 [Dysgonomonas alginatilytica]